MRVSENTSISMPMKNLISIIGAVAIGVWAYFGVTEKLNNHSTKLMMIEKDLESVVEFSIKYPRGEMGMSANDQEQNILIEFQQGIIEKLQTDVEKLKDKQRQFSNGDH
jgi:ribosome-associated translation inhibitor RaiA